MKSGCSKWRVIDCKFKKVRDIKAHEKKIYDCVFAKHNGDRVLSVSNDKRLNYWDVYNGKLLKEISLKYAWVMSCDASPSGRFACTTDIKNLCTVFRLEDENLGVKKTKSSAYSKNDDFICELNGHTGSLRFPGVNVFGLGLMCC